MADDGDDAQARLEPPSLFRRRKRRPAAAQPEPEAGGRPVQSEPAGTSLLPPDDGAAWPEDSPSADEPAPVEALAQDDEPVPVDAPGPVEPSADAAPVESPAPAPVEEEPASASAADTVSADAAAPPRSGLLTTAAAPVPAAPAAPAAAPVPAPVPAPVAATPPPAQPATRDDDWTVPVDVPQSPDEAAVRPPRAPWLTGPLAAVVTGLVVGILVVVLTVAGEHLCTALKGTSSCGGPGLFLLIAILIVAVLVGTAMLRAAQVRDPGSTSVLAVGLLSVLILLFLVGSIFSWWMIIAIPVFSMGSFALSHWVTTAVVTEGTELDPSPDEERVRDVR